MTQDTAAGPVAGRRLAGLDGLRGVAVAGVLVAHTIPRFDLAGYFGVELFFVLSGFLITRLLLDEHSRYGRISLRDFYVRRILRLWPAMWTFVAVCAIYAVIVGGDTGRETLRGAVPTLTFWSNWARIGGHDLGVLGVTWSLSIEEQFYLVWPAVIIGLLALKWPFRRIAGFAVGIAVAVFVWRLHLRHASAARLYNGTDVRADGLALGCAMAAWVRTVPLRLGTKQLLQCVGAAAAAGLTVASLFPSFGNYLALWRGISLAAPLSAAVVALVTIAPQRFAVSALEWRPVRWLGVLSYSVYLWHFLVYDAVHRLDASAPVKGVLKLGLTLLVAYLSRRLIEAPFLRLKGRFRPKTESAPMTDASQKPPDPPRADGPTANEIRVDPQTSRVTPP